MCRRISSPSAGHKAHESLEHACRARYGQAVERVAERYIAQCATCFLQLMDTFGGEYFVGAQGSDTLLVLKQANLVLKQAHLPP